MASDISSDSLELATTDVNILGGEGEGEEENQMLSSKGGMAWTIGGDEKEMGGVEDNMGGEVESGAEMGEVSMSKRSSEGFLTNMARVLESPRRGGRGGGQGGGKFDVHNMRGLGGGADSAGTESSGSANMNISAFSLDQGGIAGAVEELTSFSQLSQKDLIKATRQLVSVDSDLSDERRRYDARGCASIAALIRKRAFLAKEAAAKVQERIWEVRKEKMEAEIKRRWAGVGMKGGKGGGKGVSRVSHPRWGFDNLPREREKWLGSKVKRRGYWVDGGAGGWQRKASNTATSLPAENPAEGAVMGPWDYTAFKDNLMASLHERLLMKMCFVAMAKAGEVGRLRKRLVVRLIKLR